MDSQYRFGNIAVNCEGYSYPDDPYVLKGSCGVRDVIPVVRLFICPGRQSHNKK